MTLNPRLFTAPVIAALALAAIALTGCAGNTASPGQPSQDGPSVGIGETVPEEGSPFTATAGDHSTVEDAWTKLADSCDEMDEVGGTVRDLVCDPSGKITALTDTIEVDFAERWGDDGYVSFSSIEKAVHGPNRIMLEDLEMFLVGTLHVQSGTVAFLPSHM